MKNKRISDLLVSTCTGTASREATNTSRLRTKCVVSMRTIFKTSTRLTISLERNPNFTTDAVTNSEGSTAEMKRKLFHNEREPGSEFHFYGIALDESTVIRNNKHSNNTASAQRMTVGNNMFLKGVHYLCTPTKLSR